MIDIDSIKNHYYRNIVILVATLIAVESLGYCNLKSYLQ